MTTDVAATEASGRSTALRRRVLDTPWLPVLGALLLMMVIFTVANPNFMSTKNLLNIAADMSQIGVMAIATTVVLIAGGIDLSVGGMLALSAVTGALVFQIDSPWALPLGLLAMLVTGAVVGSANGFLTVYADLPPFVVTLAMLGITVGISYQLSNGTGISGIPEVLSSSFGFARPFGIPAPVILWLVLAAVLAVVLSSTRFGIRNYAIGSNRSAAERSGVDAKKHLVTVYVISGLFSGIAAIIDVSRFSTAAVAAHQTDVLAVVSAAVIGGTSLFGGIGRIGGTLVGVAIIGVLTNGLILMGVQPYMQQVATGLFLLAALLMHRFRESKRRAHVST